jgi:hypothetical protein
VGFFLLHPRAVRPIGLIDLFAIVRDNLSLCAQSCLTCAFLHSALAPDRYDDPVICRACASAGVSLALDDGLSNDASSALGPRAIPGQLSFVTALRGRSPRPP